MARARIIVAFVAAVAILASTATIAAANPLLGTWQSMYRGRDASSSLIYFVTFWPNGAYQTQIYFGANKRGKGAGLAVILGGYEVTGSNSFAYWEQRYLICPGGANCGDYPHGDANFGRRKTSSFRLTGEYRMESGGMTWTRVQ